LRLFNPVLHSSDLRFVSKGYLVLFVNFVEHPLNGNVDQSSYFTHFNEFVLRVTDLLHVNVVI
jgi:hypothetical protein